jgi:hypothetical protein
MRSHHTVSCFFIAGITGDHDITPVHPHSHIHTRYQERVAVVAVLAAKFLVNPYPLAHGDPAGEIDIPVAHFRIPVKYDTRLFKQHHYTFPRNLFCRGIF